MSKILVAYFSASSGRVTERAAKSLAEAAGADLYEIVPAVPYGAADLNWNDRHSRSTAEMNDVGSRPKIAGAMPDVSKYDAVLIGFPIWWYEAPRIISTFLEAADFSGRTVAAFATSGGSGMGDADEKLKAICPSANWKKGRLLRASESKERLAEWLRELGV